MRRQLYRQGTIDRLMFAIASRISEIRPPLRPPRRSDRRLHRRRARGYFANETINVACIGTGGRCRKLMESLVKVPGVRIAAVCDIWDVHLDLAKKLADPQADRRRRTIARFSIARISTPC